MIEWDARQYSIFSNERAEPNIDLISKLSIEPKRIADLGCGAGDCSTFFYGNAIRARRYWRSIHLHLLFETQV